MVNNYWTLLLSRALIGFCVGLNNSPTGIYVVEHASCRSLYVFGAVITDFIYGVAAAWIGVIGYLFLDILGWRVFLLLTSLPFFLPPILMLHFYFTEDGSRANNEEGPDCTEEIVVPNIKTRIVKVSLLSMCNVLLGFGSILLLPALLRVYNIEGNSTGCTAVQGAQFLILAGVLGGGNLLGALLALKLHNMFNFRVVQGILAVMMMAFYGAMLIQGNYFITVLSMSLARLTYAMMNFEITLLNYDPTFFGTATLLKATAVTWGMWAVGAMVGTSLAAFVPPFTAVMASFAVSFIQIAVVGCLHER